MSKLFTLFIVSILSFVTGLCQGKWKKQTEENVFANPPFKECHASTIVELNPGKFMVAFFGGDHERNKNVVIWMTVFENSKWTPPVLVADGIINESLRFPCWNPVLFKSNAGELFLFYKVGPSPQEWWGMVRSSLDDGKTWSDARRLPDGILGPIKNKPLQLSDGTLISPSSTETGTWKVHIERSTDNGKTWQLVPVDHQTRFEVIQPTLLLYPVNRLQMLCRSDQDRIVESWSNDNGKSWSNLSTTNLFNPNSGIDAVTLKNGWQLLVYNPTIRGREWHNGRGKLHVAVSRNGKDWEEIIILEDGKDKEFSYPAVIQAKDGKVHITYTYDRKNIKHVVLEEIK
ncbi:MAG: exo-alpha-sialidase [Chitinophagaceae bacterium]|nr:exo-alpha-sialidase [Chitinophagaceae bacterium]